MIVCVRGDPANVQAIPSVFTTPTVGPCDPRSYYWWWLPSSSHRAGSSCHAVPILHWRHARMLIFYHSQSSPLLFHKNCAQNHNGLFKNVTFTSGLSWCCCHWFGIFMPICLVVGHTYLLSPQAESPEGRIVLLKLFRDASQIHQLAFARMDRLVDEVHPITRVST